jgi:3'(2'), 5'-bisphosphate nucleotidase
MLQHELETAIFAARLAAETILKHYASGFETEHKIGADSFSEPVTIADRESSRIIVDALSSAFPDDGVLSEEEIDDLPHRLEQERTWIIDPIDGTSGFVNHDGDFAVQIGLAVGGVAMLGVVLLPFHHVLTYAVRGGGAFVQTGRHGSPSALRVSNTADLNRLRLAMSRNHASPRMARIITEFGFPEIIRRGSVGLKVGLIAQRESDIYIHPSPRTKLWDTCGPQVILEEAGGRFTDLFGQEFTYDRADVQNHNGIIATNGVSHDAVVERMKPLLAEFGRVPHVY